MINNLICFGLVIIPYLSLLGFNGREPRLMLSLFITLALSVLGHNKIDFSKRFLIIGIFLLYCLFASWQAPRPLVLYNGVNIGNFYLYKPLLILFTYSFAFVVLSESKLDHNKIATVITYSAIIMAVHSIFQSLGFNQWFNPIGGDRLNQISGFLGNRAILASWLVISLPYVLKLRKWKYAFIIAISVLLTRTQVPIGAMLIMLLVYIARGNKRLLLIPLLAIILISTISVVDIIQSKESGKRYIFHDSYRLANWKQIFNDVSNPIVTGKSYSMAGKGLGSFQYIYHDEHKNDYHEAHNEYLEVLYELGIFGLILLLYIIYQFIFNIPITKDNNYLFSSLVASLLIAGGLFIWQLGSTSFYTMITLALFNNRREYGISN